MRAAGDRDILDSSGHDEDDEGVLVRWVEAKLGRRAEEERADVHGGTGLIRRNELGVHSDSFVDAVDEVLLGNGWDADEFG